MYLMHEIAQKVEDQLDFQYPDDLRRQGGSGVIFACEAHIKDPINAESTLFMELKNVERF